MPPFVFVFLFKEHRTFILTTEKILRAIKTISKFFPHKEITI